MLSMKVKWLLQRRFMVAALGFLVTFMLHALRINLGIAMVAMVNDTTSIAPINDSDTSTECPVEGLYNSTKSKPPSGEFFWSPELQGYIQSAGYLGYIIFQIPGGILAGKFGAKRVIIYGHLIEALSNFLSPVAARSHPYLLLTVTLLRGMAQAVKPPSISVLSAKWFPRNERGHLSAFIYCGFPAGAFLIGPLCGILCDLEFLGGWPLSFYTFGLASIAIALLFCFLFYDTPEEDPWISKSELEHIQTHQPEQTNDINLPTPWFYIITSLHTNMMILAIFGQYWLSFYNLSIHPTYLGTVLHFPIKENGVKTGLAYIPAIITGWITCFFSHWLCNRRKVGISTIRKGTNSLSCLIFVIGMVGIYFAKCNKLLNIVFLYVAISGNGVFAGGSSITAPDMSPTFCGPLMGYASTMASFSGLVAPVMVGHLTNEAQNLTQWGKVFLIIAGVPLVTGLLYQLFGSAEIQPWDPAYRKPQEKEKAKENGTVSQESTKF